MIADGITDEFLTLILDMKTRWDTYYLMCERFEKCLSAVKKTLIDIKSQMSLSIREENLLRDIVEVLRPVYLTVNLLFADAANLAIADGVLCQMFLEIDNCCTELAEELKKELKVRITQRHTIVSDVIHHLINYGSPQTIGRYVKVALKETVEKSIKLHAMDLCSHLMTISEHEESAHDDSDDPPADLSFDEKIKMIFKQNTSQNIINSTPQTHKRSPSMQPSSNSSISNNKSSKSRGRPSKKQRTPVDIEIEQLKETCERGPILQKTLEYLLEISPTSVDSERAFSLAGLFVTKIRSQVGAKSIFALTFLNSFFNKIFKKQQKK